MLRFIKHPIQTFVLLLFANWLTSCSEFIKPQLAESPQVLEYVYTHYASFEMLENAISDVLFRSITGDLEQNPQYNEDDKLKNVSMIDWKINSAVYGDDFIGYLIIYEVQGPLNSYYVLLDLIEWYDNDSRFQAKILATEETLSDIYNYLE